MGILLNVYINKTRGINKVISISKIKKISLIRKNWILNGIRDFEIGSNPHSNGDIFSRFFNSFKEINIFKIKIMRAIKKNIIIIEIKNKIIYINILLNFLIGN